MDGVSPLSGYSGRRHRTMVTRPAGLYLIVVQSFALGLGALPVYLIARRRFARPSVGLLFAVAYLMYAPLQNINWRDFHPEALVIAPFLFAWYCAITGRWRWFFACCVIAMATCRRST